MAVEERRRIALHRAAAQSWGEEVADTLVDLVAPSGHELATRQDIEGILLAMSAMDARWDERSRAMEARWDERTEATASRAQVELQVVKHELLGAFERRIADAVTHQTRTLVFSQLAALLVIAGLAFGLR